MTFGSLFSGIGGFDLGLERAGMVCLWQVEIDRHCRGLLMSRWPTVERHEDVRVVGTTLAPVGLICGGFPCQDLSVAGARAGLGGERSGLWFEFHRILGIARPRLVLIENVPGLLSSDEGRDFAVILRGLVELGYGVAWRILDAQFAGLAQRRQRVFIVGSLGTGCAAEILFEPASVRWHPAPRRTSGERVGPTLARGAGGGGLGPDAETSGGLVSQALRVGGREQGGGSSGDNTPIIAQTIRSNMRNNSDPYTEAGGLIPDVAWACQERDGKGPDSDTKEGHLIPVSVGENGRGEAMGVRRLTPRECERLQGFPDDWTAGFSDSTRYKMLGNAVAVPVATWIGRRILEAAS